MAPLPASYVEERFCVNCNTFRPHDIEEESPGEWVAFCGFCGYEEAD